MFPYSLEKKFKYLLCVCGMFNDILCRENPLSLKEVFIQLEEKYSTSVCVYAGGYFYQSVCPRIKLAMKTLYTKYSC